MLASINQEIIHGRNKSFFSPPDKVDGLKKWKFSVAHVPIFGQRWICR